LNRNHLATLVRPFQSLSISAWDRGDAQALLPRTAAAYPGNGVAHVTHVTNKRPHESKPATFADAPKVMPTFRLLCQTQYPLQRSHPFCQLESLHFEQRILE
jgi:hypothetical protein